MLPDTINTSISDRRKHLDREAVKVLFYKETFTAVERYAIDVIFTEASLQELIDFLKQNRIPYHRAARLYGAFKNLFHPRTSPKHEWLFGSFQGPDRGTENRR
jgi:hypothetical protein